MRKRNIVSRPLIRHADSSAGKHWTVPERRADQSTKAPKLAVLARLLAPGNRRRVSPVESTLQGGRWARYEVGRRVVAPPPPLMPDERTVPLLESTTRSMQWKSQEHKTMTKGNADAKRAVRVEAI